MPYGSPAELRIYCGVMFLTSYGMEQELHTNIYKHIKIWGMKVYIINGCAPRKKLDDMSHRGYFMGYIATKEVILY